MKLREWVWQDFRVGLTAVERVGYGADEAAELWKGAAADGKVYAVKLSGGGDPAGLVVSAHLAAHGVLGIPAPLRSRDHRLWTVHEGRRLSVVPWLSDQRAISNGLGAEQWTAFGALLASVHKVPPPAGLPRENHTHERVAATAEHVNETIERLRGEGTHVDEGADRLVESLVGQWPADVVSELVGHADRLGQKVRAQSTPEMVVCHGDPHLGNVLIGTDDPSVWLIDWDDAVLAPPERDLMFVAVGVLLPDLPVTPEQQSWFFDGYGPAELDPTRLAYYRCTRALEDLVYPAAQVLNPARYPEPEREFALSIVEAVLAPSGLAELALESARGIGPPS